MKIKLKHYNYKKSILVIIIIISSILIFSSDFYINKLASGVNIIKDTFKPVNPSIEEYLSKHEKDIINKNEIDSNITSILIKDNGVYVSKNFNTDTGEEIEFLSLVKDDMIDNFNKKITELLYLKYPKFISSVLMEDSTKKYYFLEENEFVIYYDNYVIEPNPNRDLYLIVNYNEVKDYLNITMKLDSNYQNEDGSKIDKSKKLIAITFDDGPGKYTDRLINILNDNKARATFFTLGKNLSSYKSTLQFANNSNMEIGYHTYGHTHLKTQSIDEIKKELNTSNEILEKIIGKKFSLFRPPYGELTEDIKSNINTSFVLWNVDTNDWQTKNKDVEHLSNYVLDNASDGDIILFHDIHKTSVDTMETLLPLLYVNDYQVVTVSELANTFGKTLENHVTYRNFKR